MSSGCFKAASDFFFRLPSSLADVFAISTFDFLLGREVSPSDDLESEPELEVGELDFAFRLGLSVSPLTVGFWALVFAMVGGFSSSASLSEPEGKEDGGEDAAFLGFFPDLALALKFFFAGSESLSSLLSLPPQLDVSSCFAFFFGLSESSSSLAPDVASDSESSSCSFCQSLNILTKSGVPFGSFAPSSWFHASSFFLALHCVEYNRDAPWKP